MIFHCSVPFSIPGIVSAATGSLGNSHEQRANNLLQKPKRTYKSARNRFARIMWFLFLLFLFPASSSVTFQRPIKVKQQTEFSAKTRLKYENCVLIISLLRLGAFPSERHPSFGRRELGYGIRTYFLLRFIGLFVAICVRISSLTHENKLYPFVCGGTHRNTSVGALSRYSFPSATFKMNYRFIIR